MLRQETKSSMKFFQSHRWLNWLLAAHRKVAVAVALICLTVSATSCRSVKEVQILTDTVALHDTTEIFIHDTAKIKEIKYDSVDRFVEKTVYVDTNGVVHEKEVERLTKFIYEQSAESVVREKNYRETIKSLEKRIREMTREKTLVGALPWWKEMLMYLGVGFIIVVVGSIVAFYFYLKRKK